jgi:hypothetical protein
MGGNKSHECSSSYSHLSREPRFYRHWVSGTCSVVIHKTGFVQVQGDSGRRVENTRGRYAPFPFRATGSLLACIDFMRAADDAPSSDSP